MRSYLYLLIAAYSALSGMLSAQEATTNDWIDYSKTYYKIKVHRDGLVKLPAAIIAAAGIPAEVSGYKIFFMGQEIPIYVSATTVMGSSDYIEFVGKKNDGSFDLQLYEDPSHSPIPELSLFADTASYFLVWDNSTTGIRYANFFNDISTVPPAETHFTYTAKTFFNQSHHPGLPFRTLGGVNNYYSTFEKGEGFVSTIYPPLDNGQYEFSFYVYTPYVYTGTNEEAVLETKILGRSNDLFNIPDHHFEFKINNELYVEDTFEGYDMIPYSFNIPLSAVGTSSLLNKTELSVKVINDTVSLDHYQKFSLASLKVTYPRLFNFDSQRLFYFTLENNENKYIEIENFNGGLAPVLYDLTNNLRIIPEVLNNVYRIYLPQYGNVAKRDFLLCNSTSGFSTITVDSLIPRTFTDYSIPTFASDYIIVSHPAMHIGDTDEVARYADYRHSTDGGGHQVLVINIEEIYEQYAYGIPKHPLALQFFINDIISHYNEGSWSIKPDQLLLLGRSFAYDKSTYNPYGYNNCFIPTYGNRGSDNMISAAHKDTFQNQLATGRISAENPGQIKAYLDKVIEYEYALHHTDQCDKASLWKKDFIHIGGGKNLSELDTFLVYLNNYKRIVEDTLMGAKVLSTHNPQVDIQNIQPAPDNITQQINDGLACITYLGHSNAVIWGVDIREPEYYTNQGRYPFMFSNSCFVGNIHDEGSATEEVMAIKYTLAPNRGCIGFLATVGFGFPRYLNMFSNQFYHNFSAENYGKGIGYNIRKTISDIYYYPTDTAITDGIKITCQEFTLEGDPAISFYHTDNPEYVVTPEDLSFDPPIVSAADPHFILKAVVTNTGKAVSQPFHVKVIRHLPDGNEESVIDQMLPSTKYRDTISIFITNTNVESFGNTIFEVKINDDNAITEYCMDNNTAERNIIILPTNAIPIEPCDFSIVSDPQVTLKASSASPLLPAFQYVFQLDTTQLFNSKWLKQQVVTSSGGVITWTPSNVNYEQDKVYYWRISKVPAPGVEYSWEGASFIYRAGDLAGWNQSHFFQYKRTQLLDGMSLNSFTRRFEYSPVPNTVSCRNGKPLVALGWAGIRYFLNDFLMANNTCLNVDPCYGGYFFAVFKPKSVLEIYQSHKVTPPNITFTCDEIGHLGNVHCGNPEYVNGFEYPTGSADGFMKVSAFLDSIPTGWYILMYSIDTHHTAPNPDYAPFQQDVMNKFAGLGFPELASIPDDKAFICFFKKGDLSYPKELLIAQQDTDVLFLDKTVDGRSDHGSFVSTIIGPSKSWHSVKWDFESLDNIDNTDQMSVDVIGVNQYFQETFLFNTGAIQDYNLLNVDATTYPFLRLRSVNKDTTNYTPPQLKYWRVYFEKAPELALNQNHYFQFYNDTLYQGETGLFGMGITNVTPSATEPLAIQAIITNNQGYNQVLDTPPLPAFQPFQDFNYNLNFPTDQLNSGDYFFSVTINPNYAQTEKQSFNNNVIIPFHIVGDAINPIIDVTFDGVHILDGDLVSARPEIAIKIKDENSFLPLSDPADVSVALVDPVGNIQTIAIDNTNFVPSSPASLPALNEAKVLLNPELLIDGIYELIINAKDMSGNISSANDYVISFEVQNKPMISYAVNYPNPFTTSTRFVFTLTGIEVPDDIRISIFTIGGRIVREITKSELGNLHIGRNITEYAWDGKDMFGNELANGVYLYKVSARIAGKDMDEYHSSRTKSLDENYGKNKVLLSYKNHGIGKMYKMK